MHAIGPRLFALLCAASSLLSVTPAADAALANAKPPAEAEPSPEETFAKSFVGKTYQDDLNVEGWTDLGGGLVLPPIYVHQYQREEDGTYLVLTSRELPKDTPKSPASYIVADALIVPKAKDGARFTIACVKGKDETLNFIGEAKGNEDKEWWTDVKRAWEISLDTGEISSTPPKGIRCTNTAWGQ